MDEQGRAEILALGSAGNQGDIFGRFIHAFPRSLADFLRNLMAPGPIGQGHTVVQEQHLTFLSHQALTRSGNDGAIPSAYDHSDIQFYTAAT